MDHPMFQPQPGGQRKILAADGTVLEVLPVNVQLEVTFTTALVPHGGPATVMPVVDALALQTTLAAHWFQKAVRQEAEIADLRAKLNEASGEGRVYELDADIRVTPEEFAEMKSTLKALDEYFDIDDAQGVEDLRTRLTTGSGQFPIVAIPDDLRVACAQLGFTTVGGLREFCEHYKIPVPEVARG